MSEKVFHIGPIRPPSEAESLLLQVTNGCTWNKCKFCNLYRHTKFATYSVDQVKRDIDNIREIADDVESHALYHEDGTLKSWDVDAINRELSTLRGDELESYYMVANWLINGGKNVFLQDGNSMALNGGKLSEVLRYLRDKFPNIERITSYGRAQNLARVSLEDFKELRESGLDRIHSGYESGSDAVLKQVNKGATQEDQIIAGRKIKEAGIELSVYFMPGLGGKELGEDNAHGMATVVNACQPDYVRMRTCAVKPGTELYEDMENGLFTLSGEDDKVREIRQFIEEVEFEGHIVSDHMINLLPDIQGYCGKKRKNDKEDMLKVIDDYLSLPETDRRVFQLLRRTLKAHSLEHLKAVGEEDMDRLRGQVEGYGEGEWDLHMNNTISQYI